MQSVLVTGGAGYIGSHCCKALKENGFLPLVFDNFSSGFPEFVQWGDAITGDITKFDELDSAIKRAKPSAILHLAGLIRVRDSFEDPSAYYQENVTGTLNLLRAMLNRGVQHLVFSSTASVYGDPQKIPIREDSLLNPTNPYGRTKLICEQIIQDFEKAYGICAARLRYFNAAGADRSGIIGYDQRPKTHLIPILLDVASGLRGSFEFYGSDFPTRDGTAVRDYIHVSDIADAHTVALKHILNTNLGFVANIGTSKGYTVREVVHEVESVTGKTIHCIDRERRSGDPAALIADGQSTSNLLGWRPKEQHLRQIIADGWNWHIARFGNGSTK